MEAEKNYTVWVGRDVRVLDPKLKGSWVIFLKKGDNVVRERHLHACLGVGALLKEDVPDFIKEAEAEVQEGRDQRSALILALQDMILENNVAEFTRGGLPRIESVRNRVDFGVTMETLKDAFDTAINRTENGETDTGSTNESGVDSAGYAE
jgi:hypothetical protein